jgi:hypothetical protein
MAHLKVSVFPTGNSSSAHVVLIPDLRIIRGSPPNVAGNPAGDSAIAARLQRLTEFGRDMVSPFQEIIFLDFNDERTDTFYARRAHLPGIIQYKLYSHAPLKLFWCA